MLTAIEKNRNSALTEITTQLFSVLRHQKETLEELREQVWMQEKTERHQADFFCRDCLNAVNSARELAYQAECDEDGAARYLAKQQIDCRPDDGNQTIDH